MRVVLSVNLPSLLTSSAVSKYIGEVASPSRNGGHATKLAMFVPEYGIVRSLAIFLFNNIRIPLISDYIFDLFTYISGLKFIVRWPAWWDTLERSTTEPVQVLQERSCAFSFIHRAAKTREAERRGSYALNITTEDFTEGHPLIAPRSPNLTLSNTMTDHVTIGMHLDAMLDRLDSLSSTQLYGIIVLATVGVSFLLLGSGGSAVDDVAFVKAPQSNPTNRIVPKGRQPKWHILKWLNYAAIVGFVASVAKAAMHASGYLEDSFSLVQYLVGWSLFLCYFFGFFGISFIDADELAMAGR